MTREEAIKKLESLKISLPAAKDEISEIIKLIETSWISVENDLPCNYDELIDYYNAPSITRRVIICNEYNQVDMGYMCKLDDKWVWIAFGTPKYWCKYPEPPKE